MSRYCFRNTNVNTSSRPTTPMSRSIVLPSFLPVQVHSSSESSSVDSKVRSFPDRVMVPTSSA